MSGKIFIVAAQDTVLQGREYIVIADDPDKAVQLVSTGHFVSESGPTTLDTLDSEIVAVDEIIPEEFQKVESSDEKEEDKLSDLLESILEMGNPFDKAKELRLLVEDLRRGGN
jgi:hypothetical protein